MLIFMPIINYLYHCVFSDSSKSKKIHDEGNKKKTNYIWVKVFKNGPSKICGRLPLKGFLKAVFHKFYLVHS